MKTFLLKLDVEINGDFLKKKKKNYFDNRFLYFNLVS